MQIEKLRSKRTIEVFLGKKQLEAFLTKKQLDQSKTGEVELSPWVEALEEAFLEGVGPKAQALLELFLPDADLNASLPILQEKSKKEDEAND